MPRKAERIDSLFGRLRHHFISSVLGRAPWRHRKPLVVTCRGPGTSWSVLQIYLPRSFGSKTSRRESPRTFIPNTTSVSAAPGNMPIQGATTK